MSALFIYNTYIGILGIFGLVWAFVRYLDARREIRKYESEPQWLQQLRIKPIGHSLRGSPDLHKRFVDATEELEEIRKIPVLDEPPLWRGQRPMSLEEAAETDFPYPREPQWENERPTHTPRGHRILTMEEFAESDFPFPPEPDLGKDNDVERKN